MKPFVTVAGVAAPLSAANIDTDVIMPKQFLKGIDRAGLSKGTFHDLRFDTAGMERPEFILNQKPWRAATFLVVGPNFGCGSSREHAVWGLGQLGIRALIGVSFAGIFFDNCAHNGLLAIIVDEDNCNALMDRASDPDRNVFEIDLSRQTINTKDGLSMQFNIELRRKEALLEGVDAIGSTLRNQEEIKAFEYKYLVEMPWLRDI